MLKRIFSKKSGFTLVEIIIAFAVFAIMSAMILQILNVVAFQRKSNTELSETIDEQEQYLIEHNKNPFDAGADTDGTLSFDFGAGGKFDVPYQMNGATETGEVDGLAYFVADKAEMTTPPEEDDDDDDDDDFNDNGGSQMDRFNTRLTGTRGFDYIKINKVSSYVGKKTSTTQKWTCNVCGRSWDDGDQWWSGNGGNTRCPSGSGENCSAHCSWKKVAISSGDDCYIYCFDICAQAGSAMSKGDVGYANYRLYFYDKNGNPVNIVFANYLNDANPNAELTAISSKSEISSATGATSNSPSQYNLYTASITGPNGIRIGTPFQGNGIRFDSNNHTRIEVGFTVDPELTVDSFGANSENGVYRAEAVVGGNSTGPNIYGAFPK